MIGVIVCIVERERETFNENDGMLDKANGMAGRCFFFVS